MRKTANSVTVTGELIRKEFIESTNKQGKEFRQVSFTVRYAPNMEVTFVGRYNKLNSKGEHSKMYDFVKEAFDKYTAYKDAVFTGMDSKGRYQFDEASYDEADRVTCKGELEIRERAYRSQKTKEVEVGLNKSYKMSGMYGIAHAGEQEKDGSRFTFEMFITKKDKVKIGEDEILVINGYGTKEWFGDEPFILLPLTIKVPANGVEDTEDKLDNYNLKDGITATFRGKVMCGKEMIKVGEDFDGEDILTSRTFDEFRLGQKLDEKQILDFGNEDKGAIDPKELSELIKKRNQRLAQLKTDFEAQEMLNGGSTTNTTNNEEDIPDWMK